MILVIPAIELTNGRCRRRIIGEAGMVPYYEHLQRHPAELAQLYRQENARSLHIVDLDAIEGFPSEANRKAIVEIARSVDIPIELVTTTSSDEDCHRWLGEGIFRIVLSDLVVRIPAHVERLVNRYSASRIVAGIRARSRRVWVGGQWMDDVTFALAAKSLGIRRVIYSDIEWEGTYHGPDFALIEEFARAVDMSITIAGGIDSPEELWQCNRLRSVGVDSVVVGRALTENRFPCQHIWRRVEAALEKNFIQPPKSS
ncbi:MAG: HisA/HisF-related TIM barrel protein [Chlorobi bacterium]|nr:HisA/HisF-related TIM barrel protein [Chlorobiota bacterium]